MTTHLCHNATSNNRNNSSVFVPIYGLYIAGASMVCLLVMIWDVVHGIRRKRLWLPCRWFSLNALTLTILSTAAKLTVDITTPMPNAWDQLSKLTGTAFICASMGFLLPSLGSNSTSESVTNMGGLSIFVVTVIFNICKQIYSGVIFSFIPEHSIIMFFILMILCLMWMSTWVINMGKETQMDVNKGVFRDGKGSPTMSERLKLCYLHGYNSDPQVLLCRYHFSHVADIICLLCFIVVLQVSFRTFFSHDFRSCSEVSNYGWSVRIIVTTQLLVILLASLTTNYRSFIMTDKVEFNVHWDHEATDGVTDNKPYLHAYNEGYMFQCTQHVVLLGFAIAFWIIFVPLVVVFVIYLIVGCCLTRKIFIGRCLRGKNAQPEKGIEEYRNLLNANSQLFSENSIKIEDQTLTRCVDDIKRWMSDEAKSNYLSNLKGLLSKTPPSERSLEQLYTHYKLKEGNEVSSLHLVFLQRIASVSLPSSFCDHLTQSLNGAVFDIIHSVDTKINSSSFSGAKKCRLAKAMWMGQDFSSVVPGILEGWKASSDLDQDLDRAVRIISGLKNKLPKKFIWNEVSFVMEFINIEDQSRYTTIEELFRCMKQLFVDMLHMFLMRIPEAIYKELTESPPEKYLNKVREEVKLIYQVKSLESTVQWSFPEGCNITCLIPASIADQHEDDGHNVVEKV